MRLWKRYLFREITKGVLLFLAGCYLIYSLLDYSFRAKLFTEAKIPALELLCYYGWQFALQLELLLPLAIMLTTIRLLCTLNVHRELTALMAGGISMRQIATPFLLTALGCSCMLYLNYQALYPEATVSLNRFEDRYFHHRQISGSRALNAIRLADGSKLLYHRYDSDRERFHDTYWICSPNEIVRIKELSPYGEHPVGLCVDHLVRSDEGEVSLQSSKAETTLETMRFDRRDLLTALMSAKSLSITKLWKRRPTGPRTLTDREAELLTQLHKKLAMPLFAPLACLAPLPFCLHFRRRMPVVIIYGLSIIGFVTFLTTLNAAEILGDGHVFAPAVAIWAPVSLFLLSIGWPLSQVVRR